MRLIGYRNFTAIEVSDAGFIETLLTIPCHEVISKQKAIQANFHWSSLSSKT